MKMFKKCFISVILVFALVGNVFAWKVPSVSSVGGGGDSVDTKVLVDRSDKLVDTVTTANEKLGLGLADVLILTGKDEEAIKVKEAVATLQANPKTGNEVFIASLESSFGSLNEMNIGKALEQGGKTVASTMSFGSAVLNITAAVDNDTQAIKEANNLSQDLSKALKSASSNPALVKSVGELKSASDSVAMVLKIAPKQLDYATKILKELQAFAQTNNIAIK